MEPEGEEAGAQATSPAPAPQPAAATSEGESAGAGAAAAPAGAPAGAPEGAAPIVTPRAVRFAEPPVGPHPERRRPYKEQEPLIPRVAGGRARRAAREAETEAADRVAVAAGEATARAAKEAAERAWRRSGAASRGGVSRRSAEAEAMIAWRRFEVHDLEWWRRQWWVGTRRPAAATAAAQASGTGQFCDPVERPSAGSMNGGRDPNLNEIRRTATRYELPPTGGPGTPSAGTVTFAPDGIINLGVPVGTGDYVRQALDDYLATHDARLRAIARYSAETGSSVTHNDEILAPQLALAFLKFSANARDVHLLRGVPSRLMADAAATHDRGIRVALAAVLGQCELPDAGRCSDVADVELTPQYRRAYDQIGLSPYAGGLGIRRWAPHADAAYVGQWAQVWQSSMVTHGDGTVDTLFPALRTVIAAAGCLRDVPIGAPQPAGALDIAWDLAQAWAKCGAATAEAYPLAEERKEPTSPGNWLHETRGAVELLVLMPKRGQKILSRAVLRLAALAFRRRIELAAVDYESIAYKNNFLHEAGRECGDFTSVLPWMEDGEMHMGREQILTALHLRFMLVPFADVVTAPSCTCSCGQQVPCAGSLPTPWERLAHRHTCPDLAGLRTVVHNNVEGVLIDFLKDAGMIDVHTEPREWDADAEGSDELDDEDHRRPDIICLHPLTGMRYVLDNTLAWRALSGRGVEYDATGKFSKAAETRKEKAYKKAKAREEARWRRKIRFIPLAFEISGGWGEKMAKFFDECVRLKKRRRSAKRYH